MAGGPIEAGSTRQGLFFRVAGHRRAKADDCWAAGIGTVHGGQLSILDVSLTTKTSCRVLDPSTHFRHEEGLKDLRKTKVYPKIVIQKTRVLRVRVEWGPFVGDALGRTREPLEQGNCPDFLAGVKQVIMSWYMHHGSKHNMSCCTAS